MQHFLDELNMMPAAIESSTAASITPSTTLNFEDLIWSSLHNTDYPHADEHPAATHAGDLEFPDISSLCSNNGSIPQNVLNLVANLTEILRVLAHAHSHHHNSSTSSDHHHHGNSKKWRDSDENAVYYIIVVLLFYSFGIVFMMVKYMKKERRELEETRMYKEYVKAARDRCSPQTNKWVPANRLALTALNTVNVISQPYDEERITFV